jgi:hypothetical protein
MKKSQSEEVKFVLFSENVLDNKDTSPISGIYASIKSGIVGFLIVFSLIILTKLISLSVNDVKIFSLSINDFILSFWGFIVFSFIVFISNNRKTE